MRGAAHTRTVNCVCSRNEILQEAGGRDGKGTRHSRAPVGETSEGDEDPGDNEEALKHYAEEDDNILR